MHSLATMHNYWRHSEQQLTEQASHSTPRKVTSGIKGKHVLQHEGLLGRLSTSDKIRQRRLTFAALYHPSQSQTGTLSENPGASDTAPKLLQACSAHSGPRFAAMTLLPSAPVPRRRPLCCSPFSFGPGLLPIHVRTRPASAKKQAAYTSCACPYQRGLQNKKTSLPLAPSGPVAGAPGWYHYVPSLLQVC